MTTKNMSYDEIQEQAIANHEAWDNRELGANEEYIAVASNTMQSEVDRALGLHPISIRLQKELIDDLKTIAKNNGIGYQPLIREVLSRFVAAEKRSLLAAANRQKQAKRREVLGE